MSDEDDTKDRSAIVDFMILSTGLTWMTLSFAFEYFDADWIDGLRMHDYIASGGAVLTLSAGVTEARILSRVSKATAYVGGPTSAFGGGFAALEELTSGKETAEEKARIEKENAAARKIRNERDMITKEAIKAHKRSAYSLLAAAFGTVIWAYGDILSSLIGIAE